MVFQVDTIVNKLQDEKMFSITFDQLKRVSSYSVQNSLHEVPSAYYKDIQASSIVFCVNTEKVNIKECNEIHESIRNGFFADYWIHEFSYIHANEQGWHTSYIISGNGYYNITDNEKFASNKSEDSQQAFLQTLKSIRNQTRESKFTFITVDANREPSHISVGNNMHDVTKAFYMDKKSVGVAVCIDQNIATDKEISEFVKQIQEGFLSRRGIRMTVPIALNHTEAHYLTIDHDTVLYNKLHSDQDIFKQAQSDLPKLKN